MKTLPSTTSKLELVLSSHSAERFVDISEVDQYRLHLCPKHLTLIDVLPISGNPNTLPKHLNCVFGLIQVLGQLAVDKFDFCSEEIAGVVKNSTVNIPPQIRKSIDEALCFLRIEELVEFSLGQRFHRFHLPRKVILVVWKYANGWKQHPLDAQTIGPEALRHKFGVPSTLLSFGKLTLLHRERSSSDSGYASDQGLELENPCLPNREQRNGDQRSAGESNSKSRPVSHDFPCSHQVVTGVMA